MYYDEVFENLVALYLRLNGYFTSGLILHSSTKGQNKGEIDLLAVRHPFHNQDQRGVPSSEFLDLQEGLVELLICEVKSGAYGFNKSLRVRENLIDALSWSGLLPLGLVPEVADQLRPLLEDDSSASSVRRGVIQSGIRIRGLICYPQLPRSKTDRWCLTEDEVMSFCLQCLDPKRAPQTCSRKYGYDLWGATFEPFVYFFKGWNKSSVPTAADLLSYLKERG